jgi:hypothetical protein
MSQLVSYHYGSYAHESGEVVNFRWQEMADMTARARRDTATIRATLNIELQSCDQSELNTKIEALYTAYTQNDQLFVMRYADGTDTRYKMDPNSSQCLRGPYVTKICCLNGDMEEMCNKREFLIELEYHYDANESGIIMFEQSLRVIGYIGPTYNVVPVFLPGGVGAIRWYIRWAKTPVRVIQTGRSEGFGGWYETGATPLLLGVSGVIEDLKSRVITRHYPRKIGNTQFRYYKLDWTFEYDSEVDIDSGIYLTPSGVVLPTIWSW